MCDKIDMDVDLKLKKENIKIDLNGSYSLNASEELIVDMKEMYGIDLTNENLLRTLMTFNGLNIKAI